MNITITLNAKNNEDNGWDKMVNAENSDPKINFELDLLSSKAPHKKYIESIAKKKPNDLVAPPPITNHSNDLGNVTNKYKANNR